MLQIAISPDRLSSGRAKRTLLVSRAIKHGPMYEIGRLSALERRRPPWSATTRRRALTHLERPDETPRRRNACIAAILSCNKRAGLNYSTLAPAERKQR